LSQNVTVIYTLVDKISKQADKVASTLDKLERLLGDTDKSAQKLNKVMGDESVDAYKKHNRQVEETVNAYSRMSRMFNNMRGDINNLSRSVGVSTAGFNAHSGAVDRSSRSVRAHTVEVNRANPGILNFNRNINRSTNLLNQFGIAARNAETSWRAVGREFGRTMTFSFFRQGIITGLNFFEVQTKLLGILPLVGVALGGVTQMVGALTAGLTAAIGSLGRLIGGLALLPGLYAAIGAGMFGIKQVMSSFVTPSTEGAEKIKDLTKQMGKVKADLAKENAQAAKNRTDPMSFGAASGVKSGMRAERTKSATDQLERAKDLQSELNDLQSQYAEELAKMPSRWKEISDLVTQIKDNWLKIWQNNDQLQDSLIRILTVVEAITNPKEAGGKQLRKVIDAYGELSALLARLFEDTIGTSYVREQLAEIWIGAVKNAGLFARVLRRLLPYAIEFFRQVNWFTEHVLTKFLYSLDASPAAVDEFGRSLRGFLERSLASWKAWWTALGNIFQGFRTLLGAGTDQIAVFEEKLVGMSEGFRSWTEEVVNNGNAARFFENSWKILGGLKKVLVGIGKAFGAVMLDDEAVDATVDFLNNLASGMENLGNAARISLKTVGPELNKLFDAVGDFFTDDGGAKVQAVADAVARVVNMFTKFVEVVNLTPAWLIEGILTMRLGLLGLGLIVGGLLSPFARLVGLVDSLTGGLVSLYVANKLAKRGLAGAELKKAAETLTGNKIGRYGGTGSSAGLGGTDILGRPIAPDSYHEPSKAGVRAASGASLRNVLPKGVIPYSDPLGPQIDASAGQRASRSSVLLANRFDLSRAANETEELAKAREKLAKAEIDLSKVAAHRRPKRDWFGNWSGPGNGEAGFTRPLFGLLGEERTRPLAEVTARDNIKAAESQHKTASRAARQAEKAAKRTEKAQSKALYQQKAVRAEYSNLWKRQLTTADSLSAIRAKELAQEKLVTALYWDKVTASKTLEEGRVKRVLGRFRQFNREGFNGSTGDVLDGDPARVHRLGIAINENAKMEKDVLKTKGRAYKTEYRRLEAVRRERAHLEAISQSQVSKLDALRKESKLWAGRVKAAGSEVSMTRATADAAKESLDAAHAHYATTKYDYELIKKANKEQALAAKNEQKAASKKLKHQQKVYKQALREEAVASKNLKKAERAQQRALGKQWKDAERAQKAVDKANARAAAKGGTYSDDIGSAKFWKSAKAVGAIQKSLVIIGALLGPIVGAAMAISENFMGAKDDLKNLADYTKDLLGPAWEHLLRALTGSDDGSGSGGFLGALDTGLKILGKIVTKTVELTGMFVVPFLSGFIHGLAYILELVTAIYDILNKVSVGSMGLGEAIVGGLTAYWTFKSLWRVMGGPIKQVGRRMGMIFAAEAAAGTAAGTAAGGTGGGMVGGAIGWAKKTPLKSVGGAAAGTAATALSVLAISEGVKAHNDTWERGKEEVNAAAAQSEARSKKWEETISRAVNSGVVSTKTARKLQNDIEVRQKAVDALAKDIDNTGAWGKIGIAQEMILNGISGRGLKSFKTEEWKARAEATKKQQDDIKEVIADMKFDLKMEGLISEVDEIMSQQIMVGDKMADQAAEMTRRNAKLAQDSESLGAAIAGINASIGLGILNARAQQNEQLIKLGEAYLKKGEITAGNARNRRLLRIGQLANELGFDPLTGTMAARQGMMSPAAAANIGRTQQELNRLVGQETGAGGAGGSGPAGQVTATQAGMAADEVSSMTGYSETVKGKGAILQFDKASYGTFVSQIRNVREVWTRNFNTIWAKTEDVLLSKIPGAISTLANILKSQAEISNENTIAGALHKVLTVMETEINNALGAMGASSISFSSGSSQSVSVQRAGGGGGGAPGSGAEGDSFLGAGAGIAQTAMNASNIDWNGKTPLSGPIVDYVAAGIQNGLQVTSTLRNTTTRSGNPSNHNFGIAADLSNGRNPTPQMDAFYASMVPHARSGALKELIYKNHGWSNGQYYRYTANDHFDHVHVAANSSPGAGMLGMAMPEISDPGIIGGGALGAIATGLGQVAFSAAQNLVSSSMGGGGAYGTHVGSYSGESLDKATPELARGYANSVLANYGWGPEQMAPLNQLWNDESGWRWNADNPTSDAYGIPQALPGSRMASHGSDWMTNAKTQIDWGLWYLKEGAQTTKTGGRRGYGSPAEALVAKNSTSPAWYGNGGQFVAKKPMMIGVGDKQPETVTVTPNSGANKGKYSGGSTTVVNSTINLGTLIANEDGIERLTEEIGKQIRKDVQAARKTKRHEDE